MGKLAEYLQDSFIERCPPGWKCEREVPAAISVVDGAGGQRVRCVYIVDVTGG